MENSSSPYIYERPLRDKRSIRGRSFAAIGLVAVGTAIGGGAFANSLISAAGSESATSLNSIDQTNTDQTSTDGSSDFADQSLGLESSNTDAQTLSNPNFDLGTTLVDPIIVVPFEQAKPSKGRAAIELPALSNESYGNISSATPYAGGGQTGSNIGVYESRERDGDDDDDDDRYESKYSGHDEEQEDNEDD